MLRETKFPESKLKNRTSSFKNLNMVGQEEYNPGVSLENKLKKMNFRLDPQ